MTPAASGPSPPTPDELLAGWQKARAQGINNRNAAASLGVSEVELIASACGRFVTRLLPHTRALLHKLSTLGEIKAVVRNTAAVLERDGTVQGIASNGAGMELVHADNFEMVCDIGQWTKVFALNEVGVRGVKRSVQFFASSGLSTAKFFLRPSSDLDVFARVTAAFASADQCRYETTQRGVTLRPPLPSGVMQLGSGALLSFLQTAAQLGEPLTFDVRNDTTCLTSTKAIEHIKRSDRGGWVNVLDEGMDLHLNEDAITGLGTRASGNGERSSLQWFTEDDGVALSVDCGRNWQSLARAAGVEF